MVPRSLYTKAALSAHKPALSWFSLPWDQLNSVNLPPPARLWRPVGWIPGAGPAASLSPVQAPSAPTAPRRAPRSWDGLGLPVLGGVMGVCVSITEDLGSVPCGEPLRTFNVCFQNFFGVSSDRESHSVRHCNITDVRTEPAGGRGGTAHAADQSFHLHHRLKWAWTNNRSENLEPILDRLYWRPTAWKGLQRVYSVVEQILKNCKVRSTCLLTALRLLLYHLLRYFWSMYKIIIKKNWFSSSQMSTSNK